MAVYCFAKWRQALKDGFLLTHKAAWVGRSIPMMMNPSMVQKYFSHVLQHSRPKVSWIQTTATSPSHRASFATSACDKHPLWQNSSCNGAISPFVSAYHQPRGVDLHRSPALLSPTVRGLVGLDLQGAIGAARRQSPHVGQAHPHSWFNTDTNMWTNSRWLL